MATVGNIVPGLPGFGAAVTATPKHVLLGGDAQFLAGNGIIDGTKTRDCGNTGDTDRLRPGLLMGRITSGGKWSNSVLGLTGGATTNSTTSLTIPAATSTELARRIGATGIFKITGPPTAGGTVRTVTATYSALGATSATITAMGVNEVQTINFNIASTAGSVAFEAWDPRSSQYVKVEAAAWSATDATYLSNIQAKLDLAYGASNIVVASAIAATDTDLGFVLTWSGTGVAGLPCTDASGTAKLPIVTTLPTSSTAYTVARTTAGVDGRFVTSSLIQPTDGSETILSFIPDGYPLTVTDETGTSQDQPFPKIPISGMIEVGQLVDYPADTSLKTYVKQALSTAVGGKFVFSDTFIS